MKAKRKMKAESWGEFDRAISGGAKGVHKGARGTYTRQHAAIAANPSSVADWRWGWRQKSSRHSGRGMHAWRGAADPCSHRRDRERHAVDREEEEDLRGVQRGVSRGAGRAEGIEREEKSQERRGQLGSRQQSRRSRTSPHGRERAGAADMAQRGNKPRSPDSSATWPSRTPFPSQHTPLIPVARSLKLESLEHRHVSAYRHPHTCSQKTAP